MGTLFSPSNRTSLAGKLAAAGCAAPFEEADELSAAAQGDEARLGELVTRRVAGEPLAWVTGRASFAGHEVKVSPGVFVPRRQTEGLVRRAIALLPEDGLAADLCTGSGAVALAMAKARPRATVVATDIDPVACACARDNGVDALLGDLDAPVPAGIKGTFDVVIAVVPYVPTEAMEYLPRDVRRHEPVLALDGGPQGVGLLSRAVGAGARLLRPGGALLLELGGHQDELILAALAGAGFGPARRHVDLEGDLRGVEVLRNVP